jgi:uncharacterized membrane protein YfcA
MITDPIFYAVAAFAVVIWGISKAGFGGGLGLISVPMLTLVIPPLEAAAIMLPILCVMDLFGIWGYRRTWRRDAMGVLFAGVVLGTIVGALTFGSVDEAVLRLVIGVMAVGFSIQFFVARDPLSKGTPPGPAVGFAVAATAGVSSFIIHAGALPLLAIYLLPQRLDKTLYVGTAMIFVAMVNFAKIPPYAMLGLFTREALQTALVLMPFAPIGIWLGMWLHKRIPERHFTRLVNGIVVVIGIKLIHDAVVSLGA